MEIYGIITTTLMIVLGFVSIYLKSKQSLIKKTGTLINEAEDIYKHGDERFAFVVDSLYKLVPAPMNMILNKEIIGMIVQSTFDTMKDFTIKQMDKAAIKAEHEIDKVIENK